jgi:type IV pilus assembly protein PilZ
VICELESGAVINGLATDISRGGSRIDSAEVPEFGTRFTVVARMPGEKEASRLPATVRWTGPGCFGVQFGLLGARDTYRIVDLMSRSIHSGLAR